MDRREDLLRLLDSLQAQSVEDFEIVVVDNASTDGTVAMLEGRDPRIRLVRNPSNVGAAAAKNQGIVASRGELVWFLDSDTELADPGVLERAITIMDADPRIGLAGGEITAGQDGELYNHVKRFRPNGETYSTTVPGEIQDRDCDYLPTCNCLARRELLIRWGGFDPDYFILSEDDELGWGARRQGFRVIFDSRLTVIHHLAAVGRVGDLTLANRNRVRCSLHNMPRGQVLLLPVAELREYLRLDNLSTASSTDDDIVTSRYLPPWLGAVVERMPGAGPVMALYLGLAYSGTTVRGYAHHARRLPEVLRYRRARPDFLARVSAEVQSWT